MHMIYLAIKKNKQYYDQHWSYFEKSIKYGKATGNGFDNSDSYSKSYNHSYSQSYSNTNYEYNHRKCCKA